MPAPNEPTAVDKSPPPRGNTFVQSLERGLAVIRAFGPEHSRLTLAEVARSTGLTRSAARRFLLTLCDLGYVRCEGRDFSLRPRVLELGYAYLSGITLPEIAQPHVEEFVAKTHESSSISVLDGNEIVYVVRVPTKRIMSVSISVGTRFPAYCTSMGRVLLAGLSDAALNAHLAELHLEARTASTITDIDKLLAALIRARQQGFAIVNQELEEGLISLAVPLHDASGSVVAAMNVSANAFRVSPASLEKDYLPLLRQSALQIEGGLKDADPGSGSAPKAPAEKS